MIDEKMIDKFMTIEKFLSELVGMRQEIAELKSSESQGRLEIARLRENEFRLVALMNHMPQRIFLKDKKSVYLFVNDTFSRDLNRAESEICGKTDHDLFPAEVADRFASQDATVLNTGTTEESEFAHATAAGERVMHFHKAPLRGHDGEIVGVCGIFWDVTEQRKAEEEAKREKERLEQLLANRATELSRVEDQLRAEISERKRMEAELRESVEEKRKMSEEILRSREAEEISAYKFRFLVDHLPVGIWIALDERLVFANAKCMEDLGYSQEDLYAKLFFEIVHPEDQKMVRERYAGWLSGKTPLNLFNCRFVHKDGTVKWLENKIALIQWDGKPGIINFAVDITDRKWARGELRNSIDQFRSLVNSLEEIVLTWDRERH